MQMSLRGFINKRVKDDAKYIKLVYLMINSF